jgi:prohibitin 2
LKIRSLATLAAAFALTGCFTQIDTGNVGVESTLGNVKPDPLGQGVYLTAFKTVIEVCGSELPLELNNLKPQTSDKINLEDLDIDLFYRIDPSKAPAIMTRWKGDVQAAYLKSADGEKNRSAGCDAVGQTYLLRQAREAVYDAASKFHSSTIHTERNAIAAQLVKQLQATVDAEAGKGVFLIASANVRNLQTDPVLQKNIQAAAQAQFQLQAEKNLLENAKVVADRKRVEAQGNADAVRINAEAVAKAGGKEYIELEAIKKWDGKLPVTTAGGAVPFINIK